MLIKAHLIQAMQEYDNERSLSKVGLFGYAVDYVTPDTKLYYALRSFIQTDLAQVKLTDQLNPTQVKRLERILNQNPVGPNSTNSAICDLHDAVSKLIQPENLSTNRFGK